MKQTALLCAAILAIAAGAHAQAISGDSIPIAPVAAATAAAADTTPLSAAEAAPEADASALGLTTASDPGSKSSDQEPTVYSVFKNYNWQATAGYTFLRLYLLPNVTTSMNGLNLGLTYYPGGHWIAGEGEFVGTWGGGFGTQGSRYVQGMGGPRFRWSLPHGLEIWGHGLFGGAHELPQTSFGNQAAFAYELGGGLDFNVHQKRFAYRVGANLVGTRFFNTYQYSPDISVGFVFKF